MVGEILESYGALPPGASLRVRCCLQYACVCLCVDVCFAAYLALTVHAIARLVVDCAVAAGRGGCVGYRRAHTLAEFHRFAKDWLGSCRQSSFFSRSNSYTRYAHPIMLMVWMCVCVQMMKVRAGRKKVVLELGGNAACVIDDIGVGLNTIVERLMMGGFAFR